MTNSDACISCSLAIIIPTHNRKNKLKKILIQLNQQVDVRCKIDTIVVIDGSIDGSLKMVKEEFPQVYVVNGTGDWWFTKSINKGIKYAEKLNPSHILILNDDVELPKEYLSKLILSYFKMGISCIMGSASYSLKKPQVLLFSGVGKIQKILLKDVHYHGSYERIEPGLLRGINISKVLPARGMLIPLSVIEELNYFDEIFPQYGSDYDFTLRALKKGIKSYISYDAYLFENNCLTGSGSPKLDQSVVEYTKRIFDKYSPNYILKNIRFAMRHYYKCLVPLYILEIIIGNYKAYYKHKKLRNVCEIYHYNASKR